mmetsp:Transcript_14024/g.42341  ORF Transcript_14024/g.42341 Transcript_14024/m.42341 type:complete len:164 (+) Transcript_14024:90-581(+)|eukprot:CAMPEP_0206135122 /NCGR_PEP_ID=MMETSP1473-20131121/482_1 /ASSEMBLY_ACC=CAM_ASM_001109 /TAXON_ID=1461547 /ORGANISM="Stichococcus sp, Strain RCC1054" /LENGTH=163 /DNA_ID=CAMNT_0053526865 /DNA_START=56 /DNA_END=547 /DNA_ORIENTATION=+
MATTAVMQSRATGTVAAQRVMRSSVLSPVRPAGLGVQRMPLRPVQAPRRLQIVSATTEQKTTEEAQVDIEKVVDDLKERWENTENKTSVVLYGVGAVVAVWFSSTIVGAVNSVPLLPKLLELVGLGYSAWFTYRYLLFKSSREELIEDVEELKKKITGAVEDN